MLNTMLRNVEKLTSALLPCSHTEATLKSIELSETIDTCPKSIDSIDLTLINSVD